MRRRIQSRLLRTWRDLRYSSGLPPRQDRATARRASAALPASAARNVHLLIAAPGRGNIGDQALFEAFLENAPGPIIAIVRETDDFVVPDAVSSKVEVFPLPSLVYGEGPAHEQAIRTFVELLRRARSLSIIGADIMDGRYSLRGSVRRAMLAEIGAIEGVPTRIVGFSWNGSPSFGARRALVRASRAGVVPLLRDPRSAERAIEHGISSVELVADIVFAATTTDASVATPAVPFAIVNVSGLIARTTDQTAQYRRIIDHLRSAGLHVVILPHVIKDLSDDLVACRAVAEVVAGPDVTFVEELLPPAQIRALAAQATVTVTGRMHLSIMSLMGGTPAVTMATQGKVEGLMELIGAPELCVSPAGDFAGPVIASLAHVMPPSSATRAAITAGLPRVIELARANTAGLDEPVLSAAGTSS
ncbi:polysaccharide pyruvyl transferase family protein [Leifsonia flava]|uniref:Polysaccharide pyruvyl transferase domain-containing protein n=1 Tax=Orlajensenia leifsoniae TaxID=2561933 RepID=A0A4Y9QWX1_9MICO|nr:polysaccharide pyruvyl transferase family protein [Leifsonia flava]TFV96971.1 hypothetical protein E4M00_13015 [Leifsonia flava]